MTRKQNLPAGSRPRASSAQEQRRPNHADAKLIAWRIQKWLQKLPQLPDRPALEKLRALLQLVHDETTAIMAKTEPSPEDLHYIRQLEQEAQLYPRSKDKSPVPPKQLNRTVRGRPKKKGTTDTVDRARPTQQDIDYIRYIERQAALYSPQPKGEKV
jgi:hypothetical protein